MKLPQVNPPVEDAACGEAGKLEGSNLLFEGDSP